MVKPEKLFGNLRKGNAVRLGGCPGSVSLADAMRFAVRSGVRDAMPLATAAGTDGVTHVPRV